MLTFQSNYVNIIVIYNPAEKLTNWGDHDMIALLFFIITSLFMYVVTGNERTTLVGMVMLWAGMAFIEERVDRILKKIESLEQK
ncbi:MAG: hypothetical protein K8Q91_02030 [Candidatus Vogelbacteria bacterium]|nr:hypothetical protein [Candidatus Vogelbacteria bacterium]